MPRPVHILSLLHDDDIDWLAQVGLRLNLAQMTPLVEEGIRNPFLYIILSGAFIVTSSVAGVTGERPISILQRGELVGELSFLDARPPSATVRAARPAQVLAVSRAEVMRKLSADLGFAARFYRALGITVAMRLRTQTHGQEAADEELDLEQLGPVTVDEGRFEAIMNRLEAPQADAGAAS
ncbi:MAG TPA: cyclic nucleotide-binding domain-containing protein [Nannocystis sp.]|jgi:CRP-like cAMP-binding protein